MAGETLVMTVTGPVPAGDLGKVLPHEHLFINLTKQIMIGGVINDADLIAQELAAFVEVGGRTIVDLTTNDNGRRATWLREVSQRTGVNIVMGCGYYREPYLNRNHVDELSIQELSEEIIREWRDGVADTGVRPGIIGEVGSEQHITSAEERVLRAAGLAHVATGLTVSTHAGRWPNGLAQIAILGAEGVDPRRIVVGHCDTVPSPDYHEAVARTGAYVEFDTIRGSSFYSTERRIGFILNLIRLGFIERILLSHDVCLVPHLLAEGGTGFSYIHGRFSELLLEAGLNKAEIEQLTIINPRLALTGE